MRTVRALAVFAIFSGALCKPIAGFCQIAISLAEVQSANVVSAAPAIDTAKRLDGRLFFSATERQRLDQARKRGLVVNDEGIFVEAPPNVLNGFVKRSDGSTAVWVDGNVRWNAQTQSAESLVPSNVGGPASYVTSTNAELIKPPATTSTAKAKRAAKPLLKKIVLPRLLQ